MTLEIQKPVTPNASGKILLGYREQVIEIRSRVAHATESHAGLEFLFDSETERAAVTQLIALLTAAQNRPGPVLLH
jgi:hypothetical protein